MERNNRIEITQADLHTTVHDLHERIRITEGRGGQPRVSYRDNFDRFEMRIERTNLGYSISCMLNGEYSHQLNGRFWPGNTHIGNIMLRAAGAPDSATIDTFFV
ncbi:hypothetical protein D9M69_443050 [compost metagenome]